MSVLLVVLMMGLVGLLAGGCAKAPAMAVLPLEPHAAELGPRTVSFVAHDLETGRWTILEGSAPDSRHTPWSTFKIPNSLVALETGVVGSLDASRAWDPMRRPAADYWPADWKKSHSLRSAFAVSAVWFYRDLALEIGSARYRQWLDRWRYGNLAVADGSDEFWLDRTLAISPREQVVFLGRLAEGDLGLRPATTEAFLEISELHTRDGVSLHGKTGSGPIKPGDFDGAFEGWFVGLVMRRDAAPVAFALYATAPSFGEIRTFRRAMAERLLGQMGVLPAGFAEP